MFHKKKYKQAIVQYSNAPQFLNPEAEFVKFCLEHLDYIRMIEFQNLCDKQQDEICDDDFILISEELKIIINKLEKKEKSHIVSELKKITNEVENSISKSLTTIETCNVNTLKNEIPPIKKQAILVYFECSPHIEFVIRNVIIKLGASWYHTILCGSANYEYMKQIASSISDKISIMKFEHCDNMEQHKKLMKTLSYWKLFSADKLLYYTSGTTLFKKNIEEFMEYDYISASSFHELGSGSLSLRTRQTMIDILSNFSNENEESEDMFFSKIMTENSIGKIADKDTSSMFSTELVYNEDSMGGHNYWHANSNWKDRLRSNVVIQFKQLHDLSTIEHRGGWKSVLHKLIEKQFFSENSNNSFLDILEGEFSQSKNKIFNDKWIGITHLTPNIPEFMFYENDFMQCEKYENLFFNDYFLRSLDNCRGLITLSPYLTQYLNNEFEKIQKHIRITTLKHPVVQENILPFSFEKFKENSNKRLIQIGQQYRKMTSIYIVNIPDNYKKMWLTGTKIFSAKLDYLVDVEKKYMNINISSEEHQSVFRYYTETYEEYDEYLSQNIVFIDLFNAAANNTVLECIVRKTPLIINKIPGVVDYLGENYPLYFSNLDEVSSLLDEEKLLEAHEYLKTIDTKSLEIDYFVRKLLTYIQDIF
jgi:hypothetical protein